MLVEWDERPKLLAARIDDGDLRPLKVHHSAVCGAQDEGQVRALLLRFIDRNLLSLNALSKKGQEESGQVRLSAELRTSCRNDQYLEQLAARLSLERPVIAVSWRVMEPRAA